MKTYENLLSETRARVREISVRDAALLMERADVVFLDVREAHEYNVGKIPGAVTISRGNLESSVESLIGRERRVVVYCASGSRSTFAADVLAQMGYANVASLSGGFRDWVAEGKDVD